MKKTVFKIEWKENSRRKNIYYSTEAPELMDRDIASIAIFNRYYNLDYKEDREKHEEELSIKGKTMYNKLKIHSLEITED